MITDLLKLESTARSKGNEELLTFFKQRRSMDLPTERFASLDMVELDAVVASAESLAGKARGAARERANMDLVFLLAIRRDLRYGLASRRALEAQAAHAAMVRNYQAGKTSITHKIA